jgi:hypothetical protein
VREDPSSPQRVARIARPCPCFESPETEGAAMGGMFRQSRDPIAFTLPHTAGFRRFSERNYADFSQEQ